MRTAAGWLKESPRGIARDAEAARVELRGDAYAVALAAAAARIPAGGSYAIADEGGPGPDMNWVRCDLAPRAPVRLLPGPCGAWYFDRPPKVVPEVGLPLAAIALAAAVTWELARRELRMRRAPLLAAALVAVAAALLLASWRSGIPPRYDDGQVATVSLDALGKGAVNRLPAAASACLHAMANRKEWGLTWLLVPLGLVLGARRLARLDALPLAIALAGTLALYAAAYALSMWPPVMLAESTWDRFLVQMGLPLFVLLALALAPRPQSLFQTNDLAG